MQELENILQALDPYATLAERHLSLIRLIKWIRGEDQKTFNTNQGSSFAPLRRIQELLALLRHSTALRDRFQRWWAVTSTTIDITTLLADFGFAPRTSFMSEVGRRIRLQVLPMSPETTDAAELFELTLDYDSDSAWLSALDDHTLHGLSECLRLPSKIEGLSLWQYELLEAIIYCASQVRSTGFSAEVRLRMSSDAIHSRPFHALSADAENLRAAFVDSIQDPELIARRAQRFRDRLEECRLATGSVYSHLEEHGVSIGLVFQLRQMRKRIIRIKELMDCMLSARPEASTQRLVQRLLTLSSDERSLRTLIASNSSLLAAKVAERSAQTGEQYITRDKKEYRSMLLRAAGGGALMSLTTLAKFVLGSLGASVFWSGFLAGLNYSLSFLLIGLLHWTVATKQPAMTAPALAGRLKDVESKEALEAFVDEVTHLVRSQVAAVIGNLSLVVPSVLLINAMMWALFDKPMITDKEAHYVLESLTLLGPMALFAAFTGVLLFLSSLIAGWAENWFVLHRLESAIRYNPRITAWLGALRAARWASFWRHNISAFASSISLGFMLGLVPAFASFFGLGLEVRHVTLSTGQLTAAVASLGLEALKNEAFWWCVASIPVIAMLNLLVSFYLAFRVALSAHNVSGLDRRRIRRAITKRLITAPRSFLWPKG
jgi:site-specific recombinase